MESIPCSQTLNATEMKNNADLTIKDNNMLKNNERIVVGVSGGADSMALLHYLRFNCEYSPEVIVCHINHCLRGSESDSDEEFVRNICKEWGIEFKLLTCDVMAISKKTGQSVEECARQVRYDFFKEVADGAKIATAHTLSDSVETLLFNITRGSTVSGVSSIPAVRGDIIRPLIHATRDMIERYCVQNNIKFVTDSTNLSDDYSRNKIRHKVIPVLKELNPSLEESVLRLITSAKNDEDYFSKCVDKLLNIAKVENKNAYATSVLANEHISVLSRVVARILEESSISLTNDRINSVCEIIYNNQGKVNLSGNIFAVIRGDLFFIEVIETAEYFEKTLFSKDEYESLLNSEKTVKISNEITVSVSLIKREDFSNKENINKKVLYLLFDYDKILTSVAIRQKLDGDAIYQNGMTKRIKKLFNAKKLSAYEKSVMPVITDGKQIIGAFTIGVADSVKIDKNTENMLIIKMEN